MIRRDDGSRWAQQAAFRLEYVECVDCVDCGLCSSWILWIVWIVLVSVTSNSMCEHHEQRASLVRRQRHLLVIEPITTIVTVLLDGSRGLLHLSFVVILLSFSHSFDRRTGASEEHGRERQEQQRTR